MSATRSSPRFRARRRTALLLVALSSAVLFVQRPSRVAATPRNPCGTGVTRVADDAASAFVILESDADQLHGRPVFVDGQRKADLPEKASCVWLSLPWHPEPYQIDIKGQGPPGHTQIKIGRGRTFFYAASLTENPDTGLAFDGEGRQLPRVAVRVEQSAGGAALPGMPGQLLDLVGRLVPRQMELADEQSSAEPSDPTAVAALLQSAHASCDPEAWEDDSLQYVLALSSYVQPGQPQQFAARLHDTAIGDRVPVAVVDSGAESGAACREADAAQRLQCVIRTVLREAPKQPHACLRIQASSATGPRAGVQLRMRPRTKEGPPPAFSPLGVTGKDGSLEQALPVGRRAVRYYELAWELPDYVMNVPPAERIADLRDTEKVFQALLRRTHIPLYRKWWLWQLIGTAVVVGVGAAVGASFANRGTSP